MKSTARTGHPHLLWTLKLLVTVTLCIWLIWRADWSNVLAAFHQIGVPLITTALVMMTLNVTISAYKWQLLLSIHRVPFEFLTLHRYYFIAMFFNNFLPSTIGGDSYRVIKTMDNLRSRTSAIIAVFMERLTGMAALLLLGYLSALVVYSRQGDELSATVIAIGSVGLVLGIPATWMIMTRGLPGSWRPTGKFSATLAHIIEHASDYRQDPARSLKVIAVSFMFQLYSSIPCYLLLHYGAQVDCSFFEVLIVMAMVNVLAVLPISINGIGVVDGAFVYLMGRYNVPYEAALAVMMILRVLVVPMSMIGAVFYFMDRRVTSP